MILYKKLTINFHKVKTMKFGGYVIKNQVKNGGAQEV